MSNYLYQYNTDVESTCVHVAELNAIHTIYYFILYV